ncbi:MAG TPA: VWA domain-containing protein [Vicinamibacterales bacterium]|nr:VWA domain-containing protein [Vicinamibacterales bacterium]
MRRLTLACVVGLGATLAAQTAQPPPTFHVDVNLVQTDLVARNPHDQFIADLKPNEFEVYEDGVRQDVAWLTLIHGGRVLDLTAPTTVAREGVILPAARPTNDASGRIFVIVLDDLHIDFGSTSRVRDLVTRMLRLLIHDGDMFGIVSTGTSSISEPLTYDRQVLESAIARMKGEALSPEEIIQGSNGPQGPTELRHRAHVAFATVHDLLRNLESVRGRRKAVIYLSSGYDFNPFATARLEEQARRLQVDPADLQSDPFLRESQSGQLLSETDLVRELAEIVKDAIRANATLYTIDPRGLVDGPDIAQNVRAQDWNAFVRDSQDSLRVMAAGTGGTAVVNINDFDKAFRRIDADTTDYYVLGFYSNRANPSRQTRRIEVKTTRAGVKVSYRRVQ